MDALDELTKAVVDFRNERDWEQFHNSKDLALALSIEASELNELFLWKSADEADEMRIQEELADILTFALLLAHDRKLNIRQIVLNKLDINARKYPVNKAKGNAKKYNEL